MSIIVYKCDTCKRQVQVVEQRLSLDVIQRCIITQNCTGKLSQIDRYQDRTVPKLTRFEEGLQDWLPRPVLFDFTKRFPASTWRITHNLNTLPTINVWTVDQYGKPLTEIKPEGVIYTNASEVVLTFSSPQAGMAQLIARTPSPPSYQSNMRAPIAAISTKQVTTNRLLAFASETPQSVNISIYITYTLPGHSTPQQYSYEYYPGWSTIPTPWSIGATGPKTYINNKVYYVYGIDITQPLSGSISSTIINGTSIEITTPGILLLFSNPPHLTSIDANFNQIINVDQIQNNQLYYHDNELYTYTSAISEIYPPITILK